MKVVCFHNPDEENGSGKSTIFITLQLKKKSMQILNIPRLDIMKNRMERVFWCWHRIIFKQMGCIFLMNQKRHYLLKDSLHC